MPAIKTVRDELRAITDKAKDVMAKAEGENRLLTDAEKTEVDDALAQAEKLGARIRQAEDQLDVVARLEKMIGNGRVAPIAATPTAPVVIKSLGQQFIESEAYADFLKHPGVRGGTWATRPVEVHAAATSTPTGGILPGFSLTPFQAFPTQFRVASLFAQGTISDGSIVPFLRETVWTNAADTVAEGGTKPESELQFEQVTEPLRKIAHWLPVTDEMLADVDGLRSYIDSRLADGIIQVEESQIIAGSGTPPDLRGLLNQTGLATEVDKGATEGYADAIHRQITAIMGTAYVMPDGIIMHPSAWHLVATERSTSGSGYLSGGSFSTELTRQLWGLPVALSPNLPADQAVVGAFKTQAQIWRKGGIVIQASNSHSDFFIKNLTAIRAEERLTLTVYRPGAFGVVDGLAAA